MLLEWNYDNFVMGNVAILSQGDSDSHLHTSKKTPPLFPHVQGRQYLCIAARSPSFIKNNYETTLYMT